MKQNEKMFPQLHKSCSRINKTMKAILWEKMVVILTVGVGDWVGDPSPPSPSPAEGLDVGGGVPLPVPLGGGRRRASTAASRRPQRRWKAARIASPRLPAGLSGGSRVYCGLPPAEAEAAGGIAAAA